MTADPGVATLHPAVAPLGFLLGTWTGEGRGRYSTVEPFAYGEEIRIGHVGKPFLAYAERSWALEDGRPLHSEVGYWRSQPGGRVELVLAHPSGIIEIEEGVVRDTTVELTSYLVAGTSTAKEVTSLARQMTVEGDVLSYTLDMAAVAEPFQRHLDAALRRAG